MLLPAGGNSTFVSEVATQTQAQNESNPTIISYFSGILGGAIIGGVESKSGAALSLTHLIGEVTSTGTDAITLANETVDK